MSIEGIREWYKRNKDLINTFILVLIAIYTYYDINMVKEYNYKYLLKVVYEQQMELEQCGCNNINYLNYSYAPNMTIVGDQYV